jgi:hypothetical protein
MTTQPDALTAEREMVDVEALRETANALYSAWLDCDCDIEGWLIHDAEDGLNNAADALTTATQERDRALAERDALRVMNTALELFTIECIKYLKGDSDREKLRYALFDLDAKTDNIEQRLASPPAPSADRESEEEKRQPDCLDYLGRD